MAKNRGKEDSIISLKVTLRGIRPPIWRRLLMPGNMTLGDLHWAIQAAMGWEDAHLHLFNIDGKMYGDPHSVDDVISERRLSLDAMIKSGVTRFAYIYDFGDDWEHAIVIEKCQPPDEGRPYPACIAGKRNCPPEDCGGSWGYQNMIAVLADPTHPEYADQIEWISEDFDPEDFSVIGANACIAARFGLP